MTQPHLDIYDPARQAEANERLNESLRREGRLRWAAVYDQAGIRLAGESPESLLNLPRQDRREWGGSPIPYRARLTDGLGRGDLVVHWDGEEPTRQNQFVRRVEEIAPKGSDEVLLLLGNPVPRSEWPEALREATCPTGLHAKCMFEDDDAHVTIRDGEGKVVFAYKDTSDDAQIREGYLNGAIGKAADMAREDALWGSVRRFDIQKGSGGPSRKQSYWQLVSDAGTVVDVEPRGLLAFRPSKFVEAVLAATRLAYAEGMRETLDAKAASEPEAGVRAPGM